MEIEAKLHAEIGSELDKLKGLEAGSDEHKAVLDSVTKLMDRAIEMEKIGAEQEDRTLQMRRDDKDRLVKNILAVASIVTSVGVTVWGTLKTLEFEKEGTVTTILGRGFINKLLPKK